MKNYIVIIDLHCDPTIPSGAGDIGGGNTYSRSLLQELQKNNVLHIYITRKKYPHLEEYLSMTPTSEFYRIDLGDWGPIDKDVLQNYHHLSLVKIQEILGKYHECSFVFHSSYWQSGMVAYELAKNYNTFYVHTILSNAKKKALTGAVDDIVSQRIQEEEKIFSSAKYLICSSLSEVKEMQELYHIPLERLILAGLKVDSHYIYPAYNARGEVKINTLGNTNINQQYLSYYSGISENDNYLWWNKKNFIYFGRIHKNKGIKEIIIAWIQAYKVMNDQMPNLWIVGGAPSQIEGFRNSIKQEITELEFFERKHQIIWWGTLPPEGISTLLLKSSVLITHSKYEAGGLVLLEALNQGVPVIATPNGYGKDYLIDWYNGFIVEYQDIEKLTQRLLFFCGQPFLTDFMGRNAKNSAKMIEDKFDFFYSHMYAYGLATQKNEQNNSQIHNDWYQNMKIHAMDTYPYLTANPTDAGIEQIIKGCTNCNVYNIKKISDSYLDYCIWTINTNQGDYLFVYYYDIINTTNIWNPYSNEEYVLTKSERVHSAIDVISFINLDHIVYKNTAFGYVIFKGDIEEIFMSDTNFSNMHYVSDEEEIGLLKAKFTELKNLLCSPLIKKYSIMPILNYLEKLISNLNIPCVEPIINIPFVGLNNLFFSLATGMEIISYDKPGLQYRHLRNTKYCKDLEPSNCLEMSLESLWSIYFAIYEYLEELLIYSNDSKSDYINFIFAND